MPIHRFLIAAIALAMPAALPALASAATVTADGGGPITLRDAGSETNVVTVMVAGSEWVIGDTAVPLIAGIGCTQATPNEARCPRPPHGPRRRSAAATTPLPPHTTAAGSSTARRGADRLVGGAGADTFFGGADADTLSAGDGYDRLDGGTGDDTLDGGAGEDLITYTSATAPVTVDLPAGTGGQPGEHDVVQAVEDVTASGTVIGDAGPNFLTGGDNDDTISGNGGDDVLVGELGNDTLHGEPPTTASTATPRSAPARTGSTAATATTPSTAAMAPAISSTAVPATTPSAAAATGTATRWSATARTRSTAVPAPTSSTTATARAELKSTCAGPPRRASRGRTTPPSASSARVAAPGPTP